jgi:DNA-binding IclR family transcriptional regulator
VAGVREGETYPLAYVAAPVFSRPGVVGFILSLTGFDAPAPGERILAMGVRLRGACDRIGAFIAGRELG